MPPGTQLEKTPPVPLGQPTLTGRLAAAWDLARVRWAAMERDRRRWFVAAALLVAGLLGSFFWLTLRTDWRTLYSGLDPDDARQIALTLTQAQIPFDVADNGMGIRVPAPQLDKARLATAAKGGVKSGRMGFEIFDKPNWVGSEFDEQVNYQRALEGELEHTVATLADIQSARVHLVLEHDSLFRDQQRPAKASVVLKLRHASLADGEADAIRNLVAGAVDGLTPDHVVLVDAAGHLPLGPKTAETLELAAEQSLEEKLIATLEPVTGPGNVRASVTLDYNPASLDETEESYDPNQSVTLQMQRSEQTSGGRAVAAGVPGAASNAPNTQTTPVYPHETTPPESAKSESADYGVGKTVKHVVESPGRVRRMTAAIVVNDRLLQPATGNKAALWQTRSPHELQDLTAIAQAAVGFDASRGDLLTVQDIPFEDNRMPPQTSAARRVLETAGSSPLLVKYTALLLGLLLVVVFGVRPALGALAAPAAAPPPAGTAKELAADAGAAAAAAVPLEAPAETDSDRRHTQQVFDQVTEHLKREPTQSSRLLQSWIHSD
jgi:flagellar M-ring protein FliF